MLPTQHTKIASGRGEQVLKAEQLIRARLGSAAGGVEWPLEQLLQMGQLLMTPCHQGCPRCIEQRNGRDCYSFDFTFR